MVIVGFLGLVTNRKVFLQPDSIEDAIEFVDAIIAGPGVELRHNLNDWPLFRTALLVNNLSGNLVTDAWIAAATQTASEHLVTFDRDFLQLLPRQDVTILQ